MKTVNIHEAKTHLSRLLERAAAGESFIIAKAGKPLVRVVPIGPTSKGPPRRVGFLKDQFNVPDDFDTMGKNEVEELFGGSA